MPKLYEQVRGVHFCQLTNDSIVRVAVPENIPVFDCTPLFQFLCDTVVEPQFEKLCFAPPFPEFFVEYETVLGSLGAFVCVESREQVLEHHRLTELPAELSEMHKGILFQPFQSDGPLDGSFMLVIFVDKLGMPLSSVPIWLYERTSDDLWQLEPEVEEAESARQIMLAMMFPVAVSMAYLRDNQNLQEIRPNRAARRRAEREGESVHTYHILKVKAFEAIRKRYAWHGGGSHAEPRLHEVRGNWAYYTPEKRMCGKVAGMVWRPSHLRGNPDRGVVEKDYEVVA